MAALGSRSKCLPELGRKTFGISKCDMPDRSLFYSNRNVSLSSNTYIILKEDNNSRFYASFCTLSDTPQPLNVHQINNCAQMLHVDPHHVMSLGKEVSLSPTPLERHTLSLSSIRLFPIIAPSSTRILATTLRTPVTRILITRHTLSPPIMSLRQEYSIRARLGIRYDLDVSKHVYLNAVCRIMRCHVKVRRPIVRDISGLRPHPIMSMRLRSPMARDMTTRRPIKRRLRSCSGRRRLSRKSYAKATKAARRNSRMKR